uniref:Transposase Tc1-like domain-containing protein n=1 Tax=Neolamprologus brichardi TaxID=32507 RepID=A0A3Q4N943_NEOBR
MPKTKEIILELKKKIVEARDKGQGYIAISKQFTVSRNAVCCIIAKTLERKIVKDVSKEPRTSAKTIVADLASSGVDVSRNTVVTALHCGGLQQHRRRTSPLLKEQHIVARLRFANEHLKGKDEFWYCCLCLAKKGTGCFGASGTGSLVWRICRNLLITMTQSMIPKPRSWSGPFNLEQLEQFTCANLVKTYSKRLLSVVAQKRYSIDY